LLTNPLMIPSLLDEAFANLDAAEPIARDLDIGEAVEVLHFMRAAYAYTAGRPEEHFRAVEALRGNKPSKPVFVEYVIGTCDANRALMAGRSEDFRRAADQAVLLTDVEGARLVHATTHWLLATSTGHDLAAARELIAELMSRSSPASLRLHSVLDADAGLTVGAASKAHRVLDAYACSPDAYPPALDLLIAGPALISMAIELERPDDLHVLQEMLRPYGALMGNSLWSWTGAIAHHLGRAASALERYDAADQHFTFALSKHEQFDAPLFVAKTNLEHGRSYRARGETDSARRHLDRAVDIAETCGFQAIGEEAARLMR